MDENVMTQYRDGINRRKYDKYIVGIYGRKSYRTHMPRWPHNQTPENIQSHALTTIVNIIPSFLTVKYQTTLLRFSKCSESNITKESRQLYQKLYYEKSCHYPYILSKTKIVCPQSMKIILNSYSTHKQYEKLFSLTGPWGGNNIPLVSVSTVTSPVISPYFTREKQQKGGEAAKAIQTVPRKPSRDKRSSSSSHEEKQQ